MRGLRWYINRSTHRALRPDLLVTIDRFELRARREIARRRAQARGRA